MDNLNIHDLNIDSLLEQLNKSLNIKINNSKNMIKDNLIIGQQDKKFTPDFVNENLLDLASEESKAILSKSIKEHYENEYNSLNLFEVAKI